MDELLAKTIGITEEIMDCAGTAVAADTAFIDDLGADSLDSVNLVVRLEEEFEVEISDAEAAGIVTVGDAAAVVRRKLQEGQSPV